MPDPSAMMQAIVQSRYGEDGVLELTSVARPRPGPGEVLVRVEAAGVGQAVWHLMAGRPYLVRIMGFGFRAPKQPIPGTDLAGAVVACGDGVTDVHVGDEIIGVGTGAYAEYALVPANQLVPRPAALSPAEAAALPDSALTALEAVRDTARVAAGQSVLVIGASGGVGSYAVQIARAVGAKVTGVASTAKLDLVRDLGAVHVIDYTREEITDAGHRYDVILDINGNRPLGLLRRALAPDGTLVIVGGEGGGKLFGGIDRQLRAVMLSGFVSQRLTTLISEKRTRAELEPLVAMVALGELRVALDRTYPLADAAVAIADLRAGRVRGKVALTTSA